MERIEPLLRDILFNYKRMKEKRELFERGSTDWHTWNNKMVATRAVLQQLKEFIIT